MNITRRTLAASLIAATALAVATVALTGCSQTANVSGGDSSAPAASSAPEASSNPRTYTKTDASSDSGKSDAAGTFTIDGEAVSEITVNGSANAIAVKSVQKVSFTGSNNSVQYEEGKAPQTGADSGANNAVTKG